MNRLLIVWMASTALAIVLLVVLLPGCAAPEDDAMRALRATSLQDVRLGGYPFWGCGRDDGFNSSFTAKDRDGRPLSGAVCCGMWKGCTVRFQ